jgi:predicted nucleic acid-binding protein
VIYVLDACALIAVFNAEPGAEKIRNLLWEATNGEISVYISPVNLLEVYYDRIKVENLEKADAILQWIYSSAIEVLETIPAALIREAARFKTVYDMSLADTFSCATASWLSATLVTADGEIKPIEAVEPVTILWFCPPKEKQGKKKTDLNGVINERDQAEQRAGEAECALAKAKRRIAELEAKLRS